MTPNGAIDRVAEHRRAVALARHYREAEGLSIRQIADRLGRSQATVKAYFYDPTGDKAKAVKARYQGVCRGCGGGAAEAIRGTSGSFICTGLLAYEQGSECERARRASHRGHPQV